MDTRLAHMVAGLAGHAALAADGAAAAAMDAARASPNVDLDIARHVFEATADVKAKILAAILIIRAATADNPGAVAALPAHAGRGT